LKDNPKYSEKDEDTVFKIATVMIEEQLKNEIPSSSMQITKTTTEKVSDILENPETNE